MEGRKVKLHQNIRGMVERNVGATWAQTLSSTNQLHYMDSASAFVSDSELTHQTLTQDSVLDHVVRNWDLSWKELPFPPQEKIKSPAHLCNILAFRSHWCGSNCRDQRGVLGGSTQQALHSRTLTSCLSTLQSSLIMAPLSSCLWGSWCSQIQSYSCMLPLFEIEWEGTENHLRHQ